MCKSWQRRRVELNHDWLKNRYLIALDNWINILDGYVEDETFVDEFVRVLFRSWKVKGPLVRNLVRDFESAMSPAEWMSERFKINAREEYAWLLNVSYHLWKIRCSIDVKLTSVLHALDAAEAGYAKLEGKLAHQADNMSLDYLLPLRDDFVEFGRSCRELSVAIRALPSKILFV